MQANASQGKPTQANSLRFKPRRPYKRRERSPTHIERGAQPRCELLRVAEGRRHADDLRAAAATAAAAAELRTAAVGNLAPLGVHEGEQRLDGMTLQRWVRPKSREPSQSKVGPS